MTKSSYTMRINRTTVDKLGIKMYDRPSAVLAEIIANSYDADAENVLVKLPMGKLLVTKTNGNIQNQEYEMQVIDDGIGMEPNVIDSFYLVVGSDRRKDSRRGNLTPKNRKVMGRKGIGKLAPFGICKEIEVETSGGEKTAKGYKIAHFILKYDDINKETNENYKPDKGLHDGKYAKHSGTKITLRSFYRRKTPDAITFGRQMARRFGLEMPNFHVKLIDPYEVKCFKLNPLNVEYEDETKISLDTKPIILEDGKELPIKGWIAYAKTPYKNPDIAGVRIYARGKIVSSTRDFNMDAGFSGEHNIRSYLVGQIFADWLDDDEDYIRSDRQDILWDVDLVRAFQNWGKDRIKELGKISLKPMRAKTWKLFMENSNIEKDAKEKFSEKILQDTAIGLGKTIGQIANRDDLTDEDYINSLKQLIFTVTPHKMLVDSLHEIENLEDQTDPLIYIAKIFETARIAEIASMGQVAFERIQVLKKLQTMIREYQTNEKQLQDLIEKSPWIIDPQWTTLSSNKSFHNMRKAFESWYKKTYDEEIVTTALSGDESKRPDFVMLNITSKNIEIIEIKIPMHKLQDDEFKRIIIYYDRMNEFLTKHEEFKVEFSNVRITLICDELCLTNTSKHAYDDLDNKGNLIKKNWERILKDSEKSHEDFLNIQNSQQY